MQFQPMAPPVHLHELPLGEPLLHVVFCLPGVLTGDAPPASVSVGADSDALHPLGDALNRVRPGDRRRTPTEQRDRRHDAAEGCGRR